SLEGIRPTRSWSDLILYPDLVSDGSLHYGVGDRRSVAYRRYGARTRCNDRNKAVEVLVPDGHSMGYVAPSLSMIATVLKKHFELRNTARGSRRIPYDTRQTLLRSDCRSQRIEGDESPVRICDIQWRGKLHDFRGNVVPEG